MKFSDIDILKLGHGIQLAGAIYTGDNQTLLMFVPGESLQGGIDVVEMGVEDWQALLKQTDILNTEVRVGPTEKAIIRKSSRQVDEVVRWGVFRRDGFTCRYCADNECPLTVDHLIPWEDGGPTTDENLVTACKPCNKARGNMALGDWLKSGFYRRVSQRLSPSQRLVNEGMLARLAAIPRSWERAKR